MQGDGYFSRSAPRRAYSIDCTDSVIQGGYSTRAVGTTYSVARMISTHKLI